MPKDESSPKSVYIKEVIGKIYPALVMVEAFDSDPQNNETHFATGVNIDPRGVILTFGNVLGPNHDSDRQLIRNITVHSNRGTLNVGDFDHNCRLNTGIIRLEGVDNLPVVTLPEYGLQSQGEDVILIGCEPVGNGNSFITWSSLGKGVSAPHVDNYEFGMFLGGVNPTDLIGFNLTDVLERMHLPVPSFRGAGVFDLKGGLQGIYVGQGYNLTDDNEHPREVQQIAVRSSAILRRQNSISRQFSNLQG